MGEESDDTKEAQPVPTHEKADAVMIPAFS
jgi:hypothetical protein